MSDKRPLTQREIKKRKQAAVDEPEQTVMNISAQTIGIQLSKPGGDFYIHEQTIRVKPGGSHRDKVSKFNRNQIDNLKKKRIIKVV
jgi:hypothetical protein